jgi:YD repeat-containing protein
MRRVVITILGLAGLCASSAATASETVTYTYDAKGRLVKVVRTGTVNNNVTYEYTQDKVNNRTKVKVTGSPNPPPP